MTTPARSPPEDPRGQQAEPEAEEKREYRQGMDQKHPQDGWSDMCHHPSTARLDTRMEHPLCQEAPHSRLAASAHRVKCRGLAGKELGRRIGPVPDRYQIQSVSGSGQIQRLLAGDRGGVPSRTLRPERLDRVGGPS